MLKYGKRLRTMALAAGVCLVCGTSARADLYFNPTGTGVLGIGVSTQIVGIDPAPGNALAQFALPLSGAPFNVWFQSTLSAFLKPGGGTITPVGLNTIYEVTAVAGIGEHVTAAGPAGGTNVFATFASAPAPSGSNYFKLYFNAVAGTASDISGTGFNSGTLILSGHSTAVGGAFISDQAGSAPLQVGVPSPNPAYAATTTVTGPGGVASGSTDVFITIDSVNPGYLFGILGQSFVGATMDLSTENKVPFSAVAAGSLVQGQTPALGSRNGLDAGGGSDILFQSDGNGPITPASVPEPSTALLCLVGLGAASLFGVRRRLLNK